MRRSSFSMETMCTIAPSPYLTSVAARRTPRFALSMGLRADRRDVLLPWSLSKQRNSSLTCSGHSGVRLASPAAGKSCGLGIAEFLEGKNFLITGGTGFLGKVLIEKILRTNPNVGKIYVMIKAKDTEAASNRLQNEVVDKELFKCLRASHGKDYNLFVARKLVPVVGDIMEANLGISPELANEIMAEVDIVVNSAGNTNFHERYDVAVDSNTLGPFRINKFAQRFRKLQLFMHVSTAYANGKREGVVLEKPFHLGDAIPKDLDCSRHRNKVLDIEAEIKLAFDSRRHFDDSASFSQDIEDMGLERAKLHGWQDTYVFTKAMGEMVINCMRGDMPVVVIRPSVIESTWREPFPGWIQGNRMADPVIIYYGKGLLRSFLCDPECVFDVIPADMVANAALASMARHGRASSRAAPTAGMHVYHVSSGTSNPLVYDDLFKFFFQHFTRSPLVDTAGQPILVQPMRFCERMEQYVSDVENNVLAYKSPSQRGSDLRAKTMERIIQLGRIYEPYTFYSGRFDSTNTEALFAEMSAEERMRFPFDARSVDWMDYFTNVHIPGLKKHVMKGRGVAAKPPPKLPGASG